MRKLSTNNNGNKYIISAFIITLMFMVISSFIYDDIVPTITEEEQPEKPNLNDEDKPPWENIPFLSDAVQQVQTFFSLFSSFLGMIWKFFSLDITALNNSGQIGTISKAVIRFLWGLGLLKIIPGF